ncbi:cryptochrome/photolyase family protein [Luteipulveratus flavus]|uniref:Cryptochrome/photolyase family protein n=1 Tax=Luteipulveratus flavus TaxID=3031728 RepID=A0ABT6CAM2_9MICO|nr:cryptochrome/photolyase family protein [Luteipulveratus sp. YIM 133296]MDF8265928.1 cryptochrome/photolyase family protein [Luteipulveratus sp. YIM 133296]
MSVPEVRLVYPHQLFVEQLDLGAGAHVVLVQDDLFFRQYAFHAQKLVLHRASMRRFAARLRDAGLEVHAVETDADEPTGERLTTLLRRLRPQRVTVYDVVDDWLARDCLAAVGAAGYDLSRDDVLETPGFVTTRPQIDAWFGEHPARMARFYEWQRRRLDVLMDGDHPAGGRWSYDTENRKKLPRGHPVPAPTWPDRSEEVTEAIAWVGKAFPGAPGRADAFAWPTTHEEAQAAYRQFLDERFAQFGPYEDAIAREHPFVFHAAMTPGLNIGLLDPLDVVHQALDAADDANAPLASVEGFVRQVIGWREYMRATYRVFGRRMRTSNRLGHTRPLDEGWWTAQTGLDPVDHVLDGVLERGWSHHIERLMVLGNAMCLLRTDPTDVYEWFMAMYVDAYDWVMVPNVYAMSQFAAGEAITTKPYVSGSAYLRRMSDLPKGDWTDDWDALYWTFVRDHHDVLAGNNRSQMMARLWDGLAPGKKSAHVRRAYRWIG